MAGVVLDIIDGELSQDERGVHHRRVAVVHGVGGAASDRLYNAMATPGVPQFGEPHPIVPLLWVTRRSVRPADNDNTIFHVECEYGVPDIAAPDIPPDGEEAYTFEVGTVLESTTTERDVNGDQIFTEFDWAIGTNASGDRVVFDPRHNPNGYLSNESWHELQVGTVEYQSPLTTLRYGRVEDRSPLAVAKKYVGKVNSKGILGDPPRMWLCKGIVGRWRSDGRYNVEYEFQRNEETWDPLVIHTREDGSFVEEPVEGESMKRPRIWREADFHELNLRLPRRAD